MEPSNRCEKPRASPRWPGASKLPHLTRRQRVPSGRRGRTGACKGDRIRGIEPPVLRGPPEERDVDGRGLDGHEVEAGWTPAAGATAQGPRGRDHDPALQQLRAFLVIVPAQDDLRAGARDAPL